MIRCAPHAFVPAAVEAGAPARSRCQTCGLEVTRVEAARWLEGFVRGRDAGELEALARLTPRRGGLAPAAVAALVAATALGAGAIGARARDAMPPPAPVGLDAFEACVDWADALNADVERAWLRCAGSTALSSRAPVREAVAGARLAFGSYAEATFDALHCAEGRVPGCADHMPARLLAARREAAAAADLVRKRIDDQRLSRPPPDPIAKP